MLLDETCPAAARWESHFFFLIFPAHSTPRQHLKLGLEPRRSESWDGAAAAPGAQDGCSGSGWMSWLRMRPQTAALGLGPVPLRDPRAQGTAEPGAAPWSRPGAAPAAAPCPRRDCPDLCQGEPLPFPPPFPLIPPPEPRSFLPQEPVSRQVPFQR